MEKLHEKLIDNINFEPKEGQRDNFSCSNERKSIRCPSLDYKYITASNNEVDKAFDLLFEEVMKLNKN